MSAPSAGTMTHVWAVKEDLSSAQTAWLPPTGAWPEYVPTKQSRDNNVESFTDDDIEASV